MAYPFDPGEDFLNIIDGLETVTYESRQGRELFSDPNVQALFHRPVGDEPENAGQVVAVIHIATDELTVEAKPRDKIIRSDYTQWIVDEVHLESFQSRYRIVAHRAVS